MTSVPLENLDFLFKSNLIPSEDHYNLIQDLLYEKEDEIDAIQDEIFHLEEQIEALRAKNRAAKRRARKYRGVLSPLRSLPPELLSEIFLRTPDPDELSTAFITVFPIPLPLLHVCRKWRNVALTTPGLWNIFTVRSYRPLPEQWGIPRERVESWLTRSKTLPLQVNLHLYNIPNTERNQSAAMELLRQCSAHFHRWDDLTIERLANNVALPPMPQGEAVLLKKVHLDFRSWETIDVEWLLALLRAAPSLKTLHCNVPAVKLMTLPLTNIRALTLDVREEGTPDNFMPFLSILRMLPQLEQLEGQYIDEDIPMPAISETVHTNLRVLKLHDVQHLSSFLDSATFPALTELLLTSLEQWPQSKFFAFLTRSSALLSSLSLVSASITSQEILSCLQHPNIHDTLRYLNISMEHYKRLIPDSVLHFLTPPTDPDPAYKPTVPMLEGLRAGADLSRQTKMLTRLFKSRWIAPLELKHAKLRKLDLRLYAIRLGDLEPNTPQEFQDTLAVFQKDPEVEYKCCHHFQEPFEIPETEFM